MVDSINNGKPQETRLAINIQSNMLRGQYKDEFVDRVMQEIHDTMQTVFGPYATDAWITKDGQPYYTRDGKEVFASMRTDNEMTEYVRKILYQAVDNQARKVGDGTTTLLILYTNLYKQFRRMMADFSRTNESTQYSITYLRSLYVELIESVKMMLNRHVQKIDDKLLLSMMYTCTQDDELTEALYSNLRDAIMEQAYIVAQQSSVETELDVAVHDYPVIKATRIFDSKPSVSSEMKEASTFFVNGTLDISDVDTLRFLGEITLRDNQGVMCNPDVCILCSGISEATRLSLKKYTAISNECCNRICIFTIDDFRSYTSEEIDDIVAYIYDRPETSGLDNHFTFEAHLYQAFGAKRMFSEEDNTIHWRNPTLGNVDCDSQNLTTLVATLYQVQKLGYEPGTGIRFYREPGEISKARYNEILEQMDKENSPIKRIEIKKRLKKLYGKFIEVNVGAKLLKDGQRRFEIVLDALLSSKKAVSDGVFTTCSLYLLGDVLRQKANSLSPTEPMHIRKLTMALFGAVMETMVDMISNKWPNMSDDEIERAIVNSMIAANAGDREIDENEPFMTFNLKQDSFEDVFNTKFHPGTIVHPSGITYDHTVVEPVSIITNLLDNSTMVLELAAAKLFAPNSFMYNYI